MDTKRRTTGNIRIGASQAGLGFGMADRGGYHRLQRGSLHTAKKTEKKL
jgi:hypothetical protein